MAKAKKVKKDEVNYAEFFAALSLMEEERGIPKEFIAEKIADAIVVAARKDFGGNEIVSCTIDVEKEIFVVTARKTVVDEVLDPFTEISNFSGVSHTKNSSFGRYFILT